jgi:hypothetical protein
MYKMVIQVVLLSGAAIFFIVSKSDGFRSPASGGGLAAITQVLSSSGNSLGGADGYGDGFDWSKFDPRQLWNERPKTIALSPKTIRVDPDAAQGDLSAQLAAKGLDPSSITVIKLD